MSISNYSEAISSLAECYRLTGADPDGNEDWRLAGKAVSEVCNFRKENDETERLWLADLEELENIFGLGNGGSIGSQVMAAARSAVALNTQQAERIKELEAQLNESVIDDQGTTWTRPTADAYRAVCVANNDNKILFQESLSAAGQAVDLLEAAGFGKPGTSNTLLGMVQDVLRRIKELESNLADYELEWQVMDGPLRGVRFIGAGTKKPA